MPDYPGRLYHNTPGWVAEGSSFHIRIRVDLGQPSLVEAGLGIDLLRGVRRYHDESRWWCGLFLLMPDHAHAILSFPSDPGMPETLRNWKRATARFHHVHWQEGFFDHRLRSDGESNEKWHYIRRNPVAKNLCVTADAWPWWWSAATPNPLLASEA